MRSKAAIAKVVRAFTGKKILVIGDLMLDRYWRGEVERISPEAPVPIVRKAGAYGVPGGAANTACNVTALGARAILFGLTGRDEAGVELCAMLRSRGVDCARVSSVAGRPTTVKLRITAHGQQVVRIDDEDTTPIDGGLADAVVKRVGRMMRGVDAVVVSDYAKGFVTAPLVRDVIGCANRFGKPVVVDPKGSDFARYAGATLVKPNRHELGVLTGLPVRDHAETVVAARQLLGRAGSTAIVVTEGKDGMTLLRPDLPDQHFPSFAREVFDVTGAGDTALATLAVALAAGAKMGDAVWLANLAAGLAVGESGTVAISWERVLEGVGQGR